MLFFFQVNMGLTFDQPFGGTHPSFWCHSGQPLCSSADPEICQSSQQTRYVSAGKTCVINIHAEVFLLFFCSWSLKRMLHKFSNALLQHCQTVNGQLKTDAAEPDISSLLHLSKSGTGITHNATGWRFRCAVLMVAQRSGNVVHCFNSLT